MKQAKMNTQSCTVDLTPIGGRVYVGRKNGEFARNYFKLTSLERDNCYPVTVIFPNDAKTLTSSFFLGMFGESVRSAGTQDEFLNRFKFAANKRIMDEIRESIQEALSARNSIL